MAPRPKKLLIFKGKRIYYKTIVDLSKKIKITKDETRQLLRDYAQGDTLRYLKKDDKILKYDIRKKPPLLIRDFDIKSFRNKKFISKVATIKNSSILGSLNNQTFSGKLTVRFIFAYDGGTPTDERKQTFFLDNINRNFTDSQISEMLKNNSNWGFLEDSRFSINIISKDYKTTLNQTLTWDNYQLRREIVNIATLFNETIPNTEGHCIKDYFKKTYKKISKKAIDKIETLKDIHQFCIKYKIKMVAYDINKNVLKQNHNSTDTYKSLFFIAYNNHLYPIKNKYLKKIPKPKEYDEIRLEDCNKEFIKLLNEGEIADYPNVYDDRITSYYYKKTLYFENKDYDKCKEILTKMGIPDKMTPYTTLKNIPDTLEKLYVKSNISSFLPECHKYTKSSYLYSNTKQKDNKNIVQIDKNKAFPSCLKNLEYLLYTDIKSMKYINSSEYKSENIEIEDHYLYIVEPEKNSILLNNKQLCTGKKLNLAKEHNIEFKIKEELECKKAPNYYKEMIEKLYEICDNESFKTIFNIMIGKFSQNKTIKQKQKFLKICNEDELNRTTGENAVFHTQLNDDLYLLYTYNEEIGDMFNKHPINIQIKDECDMLLFKTMCDLELQDKDIIKINTDSIAFINKDDKYKKLIGKGLDNWKIEEYKKENICNYECPLNQNITLKIPDTIGNNTIGLCYAGTGKTYYILNDIIPKLRDKSYIVLTPSHSSIKEYRQNSINCNVIQYYMFDNLPEEEYIIIDECGMLDYTQWNMIYKLTLMGKTILAFGDMKQLPPVNGESCNNPLFIDYLFRYKLNLDINRRNTFEISYYDELLKTRNPTKLKNEIEKHNIKDYKKADFIITYENTTRIKYNDEMKKHHKINNLWDKGAKIICKTNDLRDYGIYNNFSYTVLKTDEEKVYLSDNVEITKEDFECPISLTNENYGIMTTCNHCFGFDALFKWLKENKQCPLCRKPINDLIELTKEELTGKDKKGKVCFDFNYAGTIYCIQGQSLNNYHYAKEDIKYLNNNTAYTIISRIKTKTDIKPNYKFDINI